MTQTQLLLALMLPACVACGTADDRLDWVRKDLANLSPKLDWVRTEGFRLGYNYRAKLDWYARARACGMNGIISRLELGNDPSRDEAIDGGYGEDDTIPMFLADWRTVQPSSREAKRQGIHFFYMLNLGASSGTIADGLRDNPRRANNGKLFSPIDEVYWDRVVESRFLRVADMLQGEEYQVDGFLIDPEMYSARGSIPGDVDYGDYALGEFVKATGVELDFADLSIPDRKLLVAERGLAGQLYEFEFDRLKNLAQSTREKLQAKFPDAIMGFFLWKDTLWFKAVAAGFSTPRVPCWVGPESTYPGTFDPEFVKFADGLRRQAGVPILLAPGLRFGYEEGKVPVDFLSVLPGNLYHRSIATTGYWFWAMSRLGKTDEERKPFIDVLQTVNRELDAYCAAGGDYESPLRPAPLPVNRPRNLQELLTSARSWEPVPQEALPTDAPPATGIAMRNAAAYAFAVPAEEGDLLAFDVANVRLGAYTSPTACAFYRPDGSKMTEIPVPLGQSARVAPAADRPGLWVVGVTSHNNAFWVLPQTEFAVVASGTGFHLCKTRGEEDISRCFFYVPRGTKAFSIKMTAGQAEKVTFRVCNPEGEVLSEHAGLITSVTQEFQPGDHAGKVWWLEASDAVEDHSFELIGIPGIVAARAGQLLVPER